MAEVEKEKTKRPDDSKFRQQKLPAWQPLLSARCVSPILFVISILFAGVGVMVIVASAGVNEHIIDYTDCTPSNPSLSSYGSCSQYFLSNPNASLTFSTCSCSMNFTLTTDYQAPVYLYYGLSNFYQNHRKYATSRDDMQLMGKITDPSKLSSSCAPFIANDSSGTYGYAPCGAIANTLFNDSFALTYFASNGSAYAVPLLRTGIAWHSDVSVKFANPPTWAGNWLKPPAWPRPVWDLDASNPSDTGYVNEDLVVWMRTAAFPLFRKPYRRVNHSSGRTFAAALPAGTYELDVTYAYPVALFGGRKRLVVSTLSWLGGSNLAIGVLYLVTAVLCLALGLFFIILHYVFYPKLVAAWQVRFGRDEQLLSAEKRSPNEASKPPAAPAQHSSQPPPARVPGGVDSFGSQRRPSLV